MIRLRLGSFELDPVSGELFSGEGQAGADRVILREQPLRVLRILVDRAGVLVTRDEIKARLWPNDTIVDFDHGINSAIRALRRAFGDSAESPHYIETLARRGYRLIVPVELRDVAGSPLRREIAAERAAEPLAPPSFARAAEPGLVGKRIDRYRVLGLIGGGGMGLVYRAEDLKLGRQVALKFLPEELTSDKAALRLLEREARTSSALNNPNICTIHDIDEYEGQHFIAMELLKGETLQERLGRTKGPMPLEETLRIAMGACDGLQAAHEQNIIHRDVKPANLFLTEHGVVKILDFGVAKMVADPDPPPGEPGRPPGTAAAIGNTATRSTVASGTPSYMSPEQVRREPLDPRTDLFSLGLVLYEMATGARAFAGETRAAIHEAIMHEPLVPPKNRDPSIPRELDAVIRRALEKDRERRYPSAAEMRADLERVLRLTRPGRRRARTGLTAAAALIVAGAGVWLYRDYRHLVTLSSTDTIVLADFRNQTSDPAFGDSLSSAARAGFEQTPYLNILAPDKVFGTLAALRLPGTTPLTPETARQVALRTNSRIVIAPTIADAGNRFRIELAALDAHSGETVAAVREEAATRSDVVHVVGVSEWKLRRKLGEPSASLARFNRPLDEATSASPEALQLSLAGYKAYLATDLKAAAAAFQRAIQLDPRFALVYAALGQTYAQQRNSAGMVEAQTRAFELKDRMTEPYRLLTENLYFDSVIGDEENACSVATRWVQTYPRDVFARANLAHCLQILGQHDRAADEAREAVRLSPSPTTYIESVSTSIAAGRLAEARATLDEMQAKGFVTDRALVWRLLLAFLQDDEPAIEHLRTQAGEKPGQDPLLWGLSMIEITRGRFRAARAELQRATEEAVRAGRPQSYEVGYARYEAEVGNAGLSLGILAKSRAGRPTREEEITLALTYARAGDLAKAGALADQLAARFPLATMIQKYGVPTVHAAIKLQENEPGAAIEVLKRVLPYDLGHIGAFDSLYPAYIRGLAYLELRQGRSAAVEFQKVLDHPGLVRRGTLAPLSRLQLARALRMSGDAVGARRSYEQFLTLWKDADPDLPVYRQAKAEYTALQKATPRDGRKN